MGRYQVADGLMLPLLVLKGSIQLCIQLSIYPSFLRPSFTHSFIHSLLTKHPLCAWHYVGHWEYISAETDSSFFWAADMPDENTDF